MAIARAMLKAAPVLAWDEATSALDSHTEVSIMSSMNEMAVGRTSLVIAHRLSTVMVISSINLLQIVDRIVLK